MILIALGANLPSPVHGGPVETLEAALRTLAAEGIQVTARSSWYETAPVPVSDQPWYVNGVAIVASDLPAGDLLQALHGIEAAFGRVRSEVNAPRVVDLDLLAYGDLISEDWPRLPHPRLHERAFVLRPLLEIVPTWRHPATGAYIPEMLARVDPSQVTRLLAKVPA